MRAKFCQLLSNLYFIVSGICASLLLVVTIDRFFFYEPRGLLAEELKNASAGAFPKISLLLLGCCLLSFIAALFWRRMKPNTILWFFAIISLPFIPIGTALGVFSIYVLRVN